MGAIREQLRLLPLVLAFFVVCLGFVFAPSITLGAIGAVFLVLALLCVIEDRRLARLGQRAPGVIVDHKVEEGGFFPVIEFQDCDGRTRREASRMGGGVKKPPVGKRVVVIYDPTGKNRCEIDTFWRRSGFTIALGLFAVIFGIGAWLSR